MVYSQNFQSLNQGNGNLEEYIQLITFISQEMQYLEALSISIPDVIEDDLAARFLLIIEKLDTLIGTSVVAKSTMETVLAKWRDIQGNSL